MKNFENAITEIMNKYEEKKIKYDLAINRLYAVYTDTEGPQKERGCYLEVTDAEALTEIEAQQIKIKCLESVVKIMEARLPKLRSPYSIRSHKNKIENIKREIRQLTKALEESGAIKKENMFLSPDKLTGEQEDAYLDFKKLWEEGMREYEYMCKAYRKLCKEEMRISNTKYFDEIFAAFQEIDK